ncbi:hypothetical protein F9C07_11315 [Aspergillus flavus]|uniref:Uncharacterized protein n=1 Tax=Aspergillus flavus (strain ATCC 200026 / FGSC A1120 / IAM 13836 / NRRL 3357 / JCM 12722 / SRRC 167) TaxID=332952 RepID=A0A7U2MTI2_ASPFN|nr:uncharacterized protein G4B84_000118 [Aspergillus flavus NRRL3357]KAF7630606.1 hypothetical protein AFLA_011227 [Aspergillus flavus NRRL3357]QMW24873.1 hypothetical protein G4B84_000118 [Aspergillus flavus NRRL3357]QRD89225.1 hypothetical protein F9C07_11315 [Aspergillus flavus]
MAPSGYTIRLQKGIRGGFAPPTPTAILSLAKDADNSYISIYESIRPDGGSGLEDKPERTVDSSDEVEGLVTELYEILQDLPLESPPGSEDIYGKDISISWSSDDFAWCNGGQQGCVGGDSDVRPSETERHKFTRAVEIVNKLVDMVV